MLVQMEVGEERTAGSDQKVRYSSGGSSGILIYSYSYFFIYPWVKCVTPFPLCIQYTCFSPPPPPPLMPGKSEEACSPALTSHQMYKEAAFILGQDLME